MVWMDTLDNIPKLEIGAVVQKCLEEGAIAIVVTRNADDRTYTVNVRRE